MKRKAHNNRLIAENNIISVGNWKWTLMYVVMNGLNTIQHQNTIMFVFMTQQFSGV